MESQQPTIESVFNVLTDKPQASNLIAQQIGAKTIPTLKILESLRQQGLSWVTPTSEWVRVRGAKLPRQPEPITPLEPKFTDKEIKAAERVLKREKSLDSYIAAFALKTYSVPQVVELFDHLVLLGKAEKMGDRYLLPGAIPEQPITITPDPEPEPQPAAEKPKPSERARAIFLENPENQYLSDNAIAAQAQTSAPTVAAVRKKLLAEGLITSNGKRIDKYGRAVTTDNIGKKPLPTKDRLRFLIEEELKGSHAKEVATMLELVLENYVKRVCDEISTKYKN